MTSCFFAFNSIFFETGAMSTPTKSPNPTVLSKRSLASEVLNEIKAEMSGWIQAAMQQNTISYDLLANAMIYT